MIKSKDISVIVQGVVNNDTHTVLKSIRKNLLFSQIILSTWEGSDVSRNSGLYDILVLNKDPGAVIFDDKENKPNNLNRILVSSQNGITKATRKYVLRLRSDLVLTNANLLKLTDDFKIRTPDVSLFKQRIFAYDIFSIKYDTKKTIKQRMPFHISDWCYLGLKEDLQELFNVPLVSEPEFSRYFETHNKPVDDIHTNRLWKMSPEQYFTSSNAAKVFEDLNFEHYLDVTEKNIKQSEDFIINNFRVFSGNEWGIKPLKKQYKDIMMSANNPFTYYSMFEQQKDYKKYCDNSDAIKDYKFIKTLYNLKYFEPLKKHFFRLIYTSPLKKPTELISTISYLLKFLFFAIKGELCKKK